MASILTIHVNQRSAILIDLLFVYQAPEQYISSNHVETNDSDNLKYISYDILNRLAHIDVFTVYTPLYTQAQP